MANARIKVVLELNDVEAQNLKRLLGNITPQEKENLGGNDEILTDIYRTLPELEDFTDG